MADTFTPLLRIRLPEVGANDDLWGPPVSGGLNDGVVNMIDQALAQVVDIDVTAGNVLLTASNGVSDNSRPMFLSASGTPGVPRDITVPDPPVQKLYIVENNADDVITLKTVSGVGVGVNPGNRILCYVDSVLDEVFAIDFAGDVVFEAPAWTTGTLDITNATAGDVQITYRYSNQGNHLLFQVPAFNSTVTPGGAASSQNFTPNAPAVIPAEAVPAFNQDAEIYVVRAGVVVPAVLQFGFNNVLFMYRADGVNWNAGAETLVLPHNITMTMNVRGF